jgi:excisionase family DNA binding protein
MTNYMTVGEVAHDLNVASDTVRWWTRTGRLAAVRTRSGVRLIDRRDVEALAVRRAEDQRKRCETPEVV